MFAAEDTILQYMKRVSVSWSAVTICAMTSLLPVQQMNRPFGAVDISANLKGAVQKATTAKILVLLAEKGAIMQKTYGICAVKSRFQCLIPFG